MNELHLKYKIETGNAWPTNYIVNCETSCIENDESDCENIYQYIQWLEEKITTNEKNKEGNHSKHYHDRKRNR